MIADEISICTLYAKRSQHLTNLVEGLNQSSVFPHQLVVVCMNDVLPDLPATPFEIKTTTITSKYRLPLAAARSKAAEIATSEYLVFLDVDCIPDPNLVECFWYHLRSEEALYQGSIRYLGANWRKRWSYQTLQQDSSYHQLQGEAVRENQRQPHRYELFWSLCFGISKTNFLRLGGFDCRYVGYGGEDTDFAFMARAQNLPFYKIAALAYHQFHPSYSPPLNHLEDITINAQVFYHKWKIWPMSKWLEEFEQLGYIRWQPNRIDIIKYPSESEIQARLKNS